MSGLKRRVAGALYRVGAIDAILAARRRAWSPWLTVVTYHRVQADSDHPFDRDVIDATPEAFDQQLALFARYYRRGDKSVNRNVARGSERGVSPS